MACLKHENSRLKAELRKSTMAAVLAAGDTERCMLMQDHEALSNALENPQLRYCFTSRVQQRDSNTCAFVQLMTGNDDLRAKNNTLVQQLQQQLQQQQIKLPDFSTEASSEFSFKIPATDESPLMQDNPHPFSTT